MKKRFFALLCVLMLLALPAHALSKPEEYFFILDQAQVLDTATEDYIIHNSARLEEACGAQIVIVTVDDTDGEPIDNYAYNLFNEWEIGSGDDNGMLLIMAIDDDTYYCEPGASLSKRFSAGAIKLLLDDRLEPDFAAKDYSAGARSWFDAVFAEIADVYGISISIESQLPYEGIADEPAEKDGIPVIWIVGIVLVVILLLRSRAKRSQSTANTPPTFQRPQTPPQTFQRPQTPPQTFQRSRQTSKPTIDPMLTATVLRSLMRSAQNRPASGNSFGGSRRTERSSGSIFGSSHSSGRSFGSSRSSGRSTGSSFGSRSSGGFSRGSRTGGGGRSRGGGAGRSR